MIDDPDALFDEASIEPIDQLDEGVVPELHEPDDAHPPAVEEVVGDAAVIVPWELYRAYGDVRILGVGELLPVAGGRRGGGALPVRRAG